ncbi:MAG: hypothetical protein WCR67_03755 [Bacilli bacterium]
MKNRLNLYIYPLIVSSLLLGSVINPQKNSTAETKALTISNFSESVGYQPTFFSYGGVDCVRPGQTFKIDLGRRNWFVGQYALVTINDYKVYGLSIMDSFILTYDIFLLTPAAFADRVMLSFDANFSKSFSFIFSQPIIKDIDVKIASGISLETANECLEASDAACSMIVNNPLIVITTFWVKLKRRHFPMIVISQQSHQDTVLLHASSAKQLKYHIPTLSIMTFFGGIL